MKIFIGRSKVFSVKIQPASEMSRISLGLSLRSSHSHPLLRPGAHHLKPYLMLFLFEGKNNKKSELVSAQITHRANLQPCLQSTAWKMLEADRRKQYQGENPAIFSLSL